MTPAPVMQAKIETCKCKSFTQKRDKPDKVPTYTSKRTHTKHTHLPKTIVNYSVCLFFFHVLRVDVYSFFRRHIAGRADASDTFCHCGWFAEKYFRFSTRNRVGCLQTKRWLFVDVRLFWRCRNTTSHFQFSKTRGGGGGRDGTGEMQSIVQWWE